jgi:hypothetical protein
MSGTGCIQGDYNHMTLGERQDYKTIIHQGSPGARKGGVNRQCTGDYYGREDTLHSFPSAGITAMSNHQPEAHKLK